MGRATATVGVPVPLAPFPSAAAGGLRLIEAPLPATVTAHATPHTKGSWAQAIASTTTDTDWLTIVISGQMVASGVDTRGLLDIGIGAAAAEVAIITEIPVGGIGNGMMLTLPIRIPKASRVATRLQAKVTVDTVAPCVQLAASANPQPSPAKLVTLNADTAASTSTTMMTVSDAWTEVTASTAQPFQGLVAVMCVGVSAAWSADGTEVLSVGVGAAGAETLLSRTPPINWTNTETISTISAYGFPAQISAMYSGHIPAGTRVVTKYTTGRAYKGAIVFGIPYT